MSTLKDSLAPLALKGRILSFDRDPGRSEDNSYTYFESGVVLIEGGYISAVGENIRIPEEAQITDYGDYLICPGFIDAHVHYPQINIIASYGEQLLEWLKKYTFPEESRFSDKKFATSVASFFLDELVKNGVTTASVFCTSHPNSVDAFFEESSKRDLRMIAGKVLMDRNAPEGVCDTAQAGYNHSKELIEKWHQIGRNLYAITPRFAPTSSPEQLEMAGQLYSEVDNVYVQSHVSENVAEIEWVKKLFPEAKTYIEIYQNFNLLGPRSLYGHGIYFSDEDIELVSSTGTGIVHCPTSNLFMGSGLFELKKMYDAKVSIALGSDIAGGTSLSPFSVMKGAYEIAQLKGFSLSPLQAFYMATLGSSKTLHLDDKIGKLVPGYEADLVVIDLESTSIIKNRLQQGAQNLEDLLFAQIILADERSIAATYCNGNILYQRNT